MEIYNHRYWIKETNPEQLKAKCNQMLNQAGYCVLNYMEHHFKPQGFTSVWLLAESHLAIHTFPEQNKTYLELSGCQPKLNQAFIKLLKANFNILEPHTNKS